MNEFKWWFTGAYNYFYAYSRMSGLFGHLWTMAIEIQFYLVLPLLLSLLRSRKTQTVFCVLIILLTSTVFRFLTPPELVGLLTHTQMDSLFLGVLICIWSKEARPKFLYKTPDKLKVILSSALLLTLYLLPAYLDYTAAPISKYPIFTLLAGILVYLAQLDDGWILGKNTRLTLLLNSIAEVSFSVYIFHVLAFSGLYYFIYSSYLLPGFPQLEKPFWLFIQVIGLFFVCYWLGKASVTLIERPYANYGRHLTEKLREKLVIRNGVERCSATF